MAKFSLRRLLVQDFDNANQSLISKLAPIINNAFEQVSAAFANNLTVSANMKAMELDLEVLAPVTAASPVYFKNTMKSPIRMILCGSAIAADNGTPVTSTPFFNFENSSGEVKVTSITNLTAGTKYTLRIYCFC